MLMGERKSNLLKRVYKFLKIPGKGVSKNLFRERVENKMGGG